MLIARVVTALIFGAVLIGAVFCLPATLAAAVFLLLWLAGAWEWGAFARLGAAGRAAYMLLIAVAMLMAHAWLAGDWARRRAPDFGRCVVGGRTDFSDRL